MNLKRGQMLNINKPIFTIDNEDPKKKLKSILRGPSIIFDPFIFSCWEKYR